ncbi:MAG: hypothetical protein ACOY90_14365 [Candidatus Zhuqueibacterota bacterium]
MKNLFQQTTPLLILSATLSFLLSAQDVYSSDNKKPSQQQTLIGGVIDVSDLKIGFVNNGRFCAPRNYLPDLPSALYDSLGYLAKLDLWVGVPNGPWAPKIWNADSQKYVSLGPTVSGTVFDPRNQYVTDWSSIEGTEDIIYTKDILFSELYGPSELFDFFIAPTSNIEKTWPINSYTGLREWPGRWRKNPVTGKLVEEVFLGDQDVYISYDDKRNFDASKNYPIGAEVIAQVVGFKESYISNMVIYDLQIVNTSEWNYHDVYLGIYSEADNPLYWLNANLANYRRLKTGYFKNEYDVSSGSIFPYNLSYSQNDSPGIMLLGIQFLKTPLAENDNLDNDEDGTIDEANEELGLTGWHYLHPTSVLWSPQAIQERAQYQILAGDTTGLAWMIDSTCFYPNQNGVLNPDFDSPEQIEQPDDMRNIRGTVQVAYNLMSCGPINWQRGDTLNFVFAVLVAENIEKLKASARMAHKLVHNDYYYPKGPPPPKLNAVPKDSKVTLYWDRSAETAKDMLTGYQSFEGYKIYRTTTDPSNNEWGTKNLDDLGNFINFIPIARCDLTNGVKGYETVYPYQYLGDDSGLFHSWTDTSVTNGVTYWYSVCSYDRGILENDEINIYNFRASPMQECPRGTDPDSDANLVKVVPGMPSTNHCDPTVQIERLPGTSGTGSVEAISIDPFSITGHDYNLVFDDTTYRFAVYNLYNETDNRLIFENVIQTNGEEGITFDGLLLTVKRFDEMHVRNDETYWYKFETGELSDCTWLIYGEAILTYPFPYEYEIRFKNVYETGVITGKTGPFEIWNTLLNRKCTWDIFYDSETDSTEKLKNRWSSGDMIYIRDEHENKFVYTVRVSITEYTFVTNEGNRNTPPHSGDVAKIPMDRPFLSGDQFRIKTNPLQTRAAFKNELDRIKVVPNPYNFHAEWELDRNDSRIQFIHLPSECSIHIYTLAGDKVRTLHHTNPNTDYEFWDLLNFSNLKASYGLYVYVVDTPDGKATTGKFVILR